jgi:uncharacterized membrane protein YqjE
MPHTAIPPVITAAPVPVEKPGLRAAFKLLLEHLGDHLDLLKIESAQELSRLGAVLGLWFVLLQLVQLALMAGLGIALALLWGSEYRLPAIAITAGVLVSATVFCVLRLKRLGQQGAQRFVTSGEQWRRDIAVIKELL